MHARNHQESRRYIMGEKRGGRGVGKVAEYPDCSEKEPPLTY